MSRNSDSLIITHVDADGIGSSTLVAREILSRGGSYRIIFTQPDRVYSYLAKLSKYVSSSSISSIYITDLAPNKNYVHSIADLVKRYSESNIKIYWLDHHIWDSELSNILSSSGAEVYVDTSTCATGVVRRFFSLEDEFSIDLEKVICSIDLWRFDDHRSAYFTRLVSYRDDDEWRNLLVNKLIELKSIDQLISWGMRFIIDLMDKELFEYSKYLEEAIQKTFCGIKFIVVLKSRNSSIGTSQLGHYLLSATHSDVAVIIRENGSISFRSREYNVRDLALHFGGGGHRLASGGAVELSLLEKFVIKLGLRKILINKVLNRIENIYSSCKQ